MFVSDLLRPMGYRGIGFQCLYPFTEKPVGIPHNPHTHRTGELSASFRIFLCLFFSLYTVRLYFTV